MICLVLNSAQGHLIMTKSVLLHSAALRSFLRFLVITPFNLFMIAFPGLIVFALLILLWILVLALFSAGLAAPFVAFQTELAYLSFWMFTAIFSTSLFAFFFSICLSFLVFFISKHFAIYILSYLHWNYRFIFQSQKKA